MKQPRGTKEENKARKKEKIVDRQVRRAVRAVDKTYRKMDRAKDQYEKGKITKALRDEKINKAIEKEDKTLDRRSERLNKRFSPAKAFKYSGDSPAMRKLSASCKAAARRKFDVYPSAYANMWASKQQGKGKC